MNRGSSFKQEFNDGAQFLYNGINNIRRSLQAETSEVPDFSVLSEVITNEDPAVGPGRSVQESGFIAIVAMSPDSRHLRLV